MDNLKNKFVFVSADGDGIGQKVARAELADDENLLHEVSAKIKSGNDLLEEFAVKNGGQVISSGGDEAVIRIPLEHVEELEALRSDYNYLVGATLSMGLGESLSQASKSLMIAKINGKNQILQYSPEVEQQWAQASQESNAGTATGEAKKIGDAYMKSEEQKPTGEQPHAEPVQEESTDEKQPEQTEDDHSDCPYCQEAQEELGEDDCPYCAEDDQVEQEAGLDDCPYCQEAHAEDQHQHGDDCPHCQEMDAAEGQEQSPQDPQSQELVEASPMEDASDAPNEVQTDEHQSPEEVMQEFDSVHGEDPSQEGASETDQIGDVGIAEGNDRQEQNVSRPGDFGGEIPQGSEDPANTAGDPDYGQMMQEDLTNNADEMQKQKVGDMVRQSLQSFKQSKMSLEAMKDQDPGFYTANIMMLRSMIEMAKLLGFNGSQAQQQAPELGQQQEEMIAQQPDPANPFPVHPDNGGSPAPGGEDASGGHDWNNPFPTHPDNGGNDAGKPQGQ